MEKISKSFPIFAILLTGLILRAIGLNWGLPDAKYFHSNSRHPDEYLVLQSIASMRPANFNFKAKIKNDWLQYGGGVFHVYVAAGAIAVAAAFGVVRIKRDFNWAKQNPSEYAKLYLVGRWLNVLLGLLSIWCVYKIGTFSFGSSVGLLSSFLLSIAPSHVVNSHYFSRDMTMIACLFFGLLILVTWQEKFRWSFFVGGIFIGLAAATKHVSGSFAIFVILAAWLLTNKKSNSARINFVVIGALGCLAGFLLGHPYVLVDFKEYWQAFRASIESSMNFSEPTDAAYPGGGLQFYFGDALFYGLGLPLMICVYLGLMFAFFKRTKWDWFFVLGMIPYLAILCHSPWKLVRWMVVVTPIFVILAARFLVEVFRSRKVLYSVVGAISLYTTLYSWSYVWGMHKEAVHVEASDWIMEHVPRGKSIGVSTVPFAWHPTLVIQEYFYPQGDPARSGKPKFYTVESLGFSLENLEKLKPEYIVLSDFDYLPMLRLKKQFPNMHNLPFLEEVFYGGKYRQVASFGRRLLLWGVPLIGGTLPHDWRYPFPEIKVFRLNVNHPVTAID